MSDPTRDEQPILYTPTGSCCHVPHVSGERPLCSVETDGEWVEAHLGKKRTTRRLCGSCAKMAREVPRLADFGRE